jgi:hypothetical protein
MQLDITPCANATYNCLDVLIFTLASHWGLEHRLMFAEAWRFKYEKVQPSQREVSFDKTLDVRELVERRDVERALSTYHGLEITRHHPGDVKAALDLIRAEVASGCPVAIGVDAYFCPWSSAYQKYHLDHYCLAIGLHEEGDLTELVVIDPYLTMDVQYYPLALYEQTRRDCLTFRRASRTPASPEWQQIIRPAATTMLGQRVQQMRDLADDIGAHLDFGREVMRHEDPYASLLVLYFKTLGFSRFNFSESMTYLAETWRQPKLAAAAVRMKELGNASYKIFLLLMKMSMTPARFKREDIAKRLNEVADAEERLARELVALSAASSWQPKLMTEAL